MREGFFLINNREVGRNDPELEKLLVQLHRTRTRPLCLCRDPGIEMYVAKVGERYIVKRMPNTGNLHSPSCESYELPLELSGLAQVMGSAIRENPETEVTEIKLEFSLSKSQSRKPPVPGDGQADSVKTDGTKLSLRALLHYLWEEAEFNKWTPAMEGKRNWYVIRKYLLQAAEGKVVKGSSLVNQLYIPETFSIEHKDEISRRRMSIMSKMAASPQSMMMLIGEVKGIEEARFGYKVIFKHVPDGHFMINKDLHDRLMKRFDSEFELWDGVDGAHLILVGTFGVGPTGIPSLEEAAVMTVTDQWIPFENMYEKNLMDMLRDRRFIKGLRYKIPSSKPMATLVLSDAQPEPTAMYIIPPAAKDDYIDAVESIITESQLPTWVWYGAGDIPVIPGPIPAG